MSKMWYFQIFKCEDLLLSLVLNYSKFHILGFEMLVRQNKTFDGAHLDSRTEVSSLFDWFKFSCQFVCHIIKANIKLNYDTTSKFKSMHLWFYSIHIGNVYSNIFKKHFSPIIRILSYSVIYIYIRANIHTSQPLTNLVHQQ